MQYQPEFAFILPLEDDDKRSEEPKYTSDDDTETPLTGIEIEIPSAPSAPKTKRKQKNQVDEPSAPVEATFRENFLKLTWYVIRCVSVFRCQVKMLNFSALI